jgi:hypothetical protein
MIDEFEGKVVADKYRIDSLMSDSDLGAFYRGWHVLMDKPITVKILAPALAVDRRFVDRFLSEAKSASQVSHPNVLNVTDFGTDARGISYTVYDGAGGDTVEELVRSSDSLALPQALNLAKQAAAGLAAAHSKGLIHGSLSPDKMLVLADGETETVKVFDFGAEPVGRTSTARVEYLSPEQYSDRAAADERSDVYALGVVLYEMLAGLPPFIGKTTAELELKQESEPPPPLSAFRSDLPAHLEPMLLSAMSIDPDTRYQTMSAFAEDLELLSSGIGGPAKAGAVVDPAAPRKNLWQTAFIVLAGMSILAVALIYGTSVRKTDPTTQLQADAGSLPVQPVGPATGAQEESLAKLPAMTEAEILQSSTMDQPPGTLPGGDGFNAWANGGAPPIGAPVQQYVPPGGQVYTIDPNGGSQFMPNDGGVILVPVPANTNTAVKPSPTPKTPAANGAAVKPTPAAEVTPKPLATPPKTDKPAGGQPAKPGSTPAKPSRGKPKVS